MAYSLTYSYNSSSQSYSVTGYSNITTSDKVVIPDKYDDGTNGEHTVTSIAAAAFFNCSSLTSISIGNSVTSIGSYAFQNCSNLTSVAIPNSVTSIGSYAFYNCSSLTSVTITDGVTSIDERAFSGCSSLTSVTIGNSVTSIGDGAFDACSSLVQLILFQSTPPTLGSFAIPSNVQSIYVQQSSKTVYQAATNWTAFASKIVSDNIYLSFVRFNQKNKEYINGKVDGKLTTPTTPTADSVITMAANGTVGTKPLSELVDTTSEQTITGTKNFESTGKNFCITCKTIIKGVTYTAKLSGGDLLFINDGGSENVQANYGINGVYSRHRTSSSSGLLKFPIDLEGTFAITPNAAPTEPSFIVTAADRTPTWQSAAPILSDYVDDALLGG